MLHVERGYTRLESYEYLCKNAVRMYIQVSHLVPVHSKTHHTDILLLLYKDFVRRETEPCTSDSVACCLLVCAVYQGYQVCWRRVRGYKRAHYVQVRV